MNDYIDEILELVKSELARATLVNGAFNSAHEGYAVLLEEVDELWDEVKKKSVRRDYEVMEEECIQIAAMAVRFVVDVVNTRNRK